MELKHADQFFAYARERELVRLKKEGGYPQPWTSDPHLRTWKFCNINREHDRTTKWFRECIREPLSVNARVNAGTDQYPVWLHKIVRSTIAFRWFNRIETGEIIHDLLLGKWDQEEARRRLTGINPIVTGAYIIKGENGFDKLSGVLRCIGRAFCEIPTMIPTWGQSLEAAWKDLKTIPYLGGFMAYEVITDLRWTPVLENATDIMTWSNAGPGAARGINWICFGVQEGFGIGAPDQKEILPMMQELLAMSRDELNWPHGWEFWDMRTVEHTLCEFDKFCRAKSGERLKRRYVRSS